ncbi:cysteine hydrolase family protein [Streptomyces sp. NPDC002463]|uniref:cysteine hydrolase family protein n=1 Tax=Streptomyces sp. NPDC002463 TaxID=3364645 RepID=UPI00368812F4
MIFPELPPEWSELLAELGATENDHLVTKHARSAFTRTGLDEWLRDRDVTQVVVSGITTSSSVESTVRDAHELGYSVTVATDAVTDVDGAAHDHTLTKVYPLIAETGPTKLVLAALAVAS